LATGDQDKPTFRSRRVAETRPGPAGPGDGPRELALSLPGSILDLARIQAEDRGLPLEEYCELILIEAIHARRQHVRIDGLEPTDDPAEWESEPLKIETDWAAPEEIVFESEEGSRPADPSAWLATGIQDVEVEGPAREADVDVEAVNVVMRHTMEGLDGPGLLPTLRRGEPLSPRAVAEVLQALGDLESALAGSQRIDRRLAFALHRLAFEGQVLVGDAWSGRVDATSLSLLHQVQEAVDRVLSGEDIRYLPEADR
jgi:hypothetical protein